MKRPKAATVTRLALACALFPARPCHALFSGDDRGTAAAQFLKLPWGARPGALGGAYSALASEADAMLWNPAALRQIPGSLSISDSYSSYLDTIRFGAGAAAYSRGSGSYGLAVQYMSYGAVDRTDVAGASNGSFTPEDIAVHFAYARSAPELSGVSLGAGLKYIRSALTRKDQTWAADLGLLSPRFLDGRLRTAFVVQNAGPGLKFGDTADPLPLQIRAGAALRWTEHWTLSSDVVFPRDNDPHLSLGSEYRQAINPDVALAGRLGVNSRNSNDIPGFSALALGIGLRYKLARLDYALLPMGQLGLVHQWSMHLFLGAN